MEIKVEVISRETIRPSSRTPDHLKTFNLSIFDQLSPAVYTPVVLFYLKTAPRLDAAICDQLKASLSDTLTCLYPFAGRIKDNIHIDCNDDGVDFLEARVSGGTSLMDVLARPEPDVLTRFLPAEIVSLEAYTGSLLLVQVNFFESGGLAIGISMSHKLADAGTLGMFIKSWALLAREGPMKLSPPDFTAASVFPPSKMFTMPPPDTASHPDEAPKQMLRTRRYVFDAPGIAALKVKSASGVVPRPTRVEAVCSLLWKCKMKALKSNTEPSKPSVLAQIVNLRRRIDPPLPEDSVGNLVGFYTVRADGTNEEDLPSLVAKMRKTKEEYVQDYARKLRGPNGFSMICSAIKETWEWGKEESFNLFIFTSWCRLGLYEADFGWGKPHWTSRRSSMPKNLSVLMDAKDGEGIEAWVTLREEDMESFECDPELLSFARPDMSMLFGHSIV